MNDPFIFLKGKDVNHNLFSNAPLAFGNRGLQELVYERIFWHKAKIWQQKTTISHEHLLLKIPNIEKKLALGFRH